MLQVIMHASRVSVEDLTNASLRQLDEKNLKVVGIQFRCSDDYMHSMIVYESAED